MVDLVNIPPIDGIVNADDIRIVLYQSGRLVHAPLKQLLDAIADITGVGMLLEGDEQVLGVDLLLLEGDSGGVLLLEGSY
jgi:hypothetical protein